MKKIKISRSFTFKAYSVNCDEKLLKDSKKYIEFLNRVKSENISKHFGNFVFKSDCEYYVEKNILDIFNNISEGPKNSNIYLIYKVSTIEDSNIDDSLLMSIYYNIDEEKIILD